MAASVVEIKFKLAAESAEISLHAAKARAALGQVEQSSTKLNAAQRRTLSQGAALASGLGSVAQAMGGVDAAASRAISGVLRISGAFTQFKSSGMMAFAAISAGATAMGLAIGGMVEWVESSMKKAADVMAESEQWADLMAKPMAERAKGAISQIQKEMTALSLEMQNPGVMTWLSDLDLKDFANASVALGTGKEDVFGTSQSGAGSQARLLSLRNSLNRWRDIQKDLQDAEATAELHPVSFMNEALASSAKLRIAEEKAEIDALFAGIYSRQDEAIAKAEEFADTQKKLAEEARNVLYEVNPAARFGAEANRMAELVAQGALDETSAALKLRSLARELQGTGGTPFVQQSIWAPPVMSGRDNIPQTLLSQLTEQQKTNGLLNRLIALAGLAS